MKKVLFLSTHHPFIHPSIQPSWWAGGLGCCNLFGWVHLAENLGGENLGTFFWLIIKSS